jgi:hypothetical protein
MISGTRFLLFVLLGGNTAPSLEISPSPPLALDVREGTVILLHYHALVGQHHYSHFDAWKMYRFLAFTTLVLAIPPLYYHHYSRSFMLGKKEFC